MRKPKHANTKLKRYGHDFHPVGAEGLPISNEQRREDTEARMSHRKEKAGTPILCLFHSVAWS